MTNKPVKGIKGYRILFDYGAYEGMKFWDTSGYKTIDAAVKIAVALRTGNPFFIVQVFDWEAIYKPVPAPRPAKRATKKK